MLELVLNLILYCIGNVWYVSVFFGGLSDVLYASIREDDVTYGFWFEGDFEGCVGLCFFLV